MTTIRAGNHTIDGKGFAVSTERIGGAARQSLVPELPGGIDDGTPEASRSE